MDTTISLAENTDISSALKVADITISDDGEGTNNLILSGADKDLFFISDDGKELYLKAHTVLDFESNPKLDVTVSVNDSTVGSTPDDIETLSINVTDVNAAPTLALAPTIHRLHLPRAPMRTM